MREIKLQDLKAKTPAELVSFAEEIGVKMPAPCASRS